MGTPKKAMAEQSHETGLVYACWAQNPRLYYAVEQHPMYISDYELQIEGLNTKVSAMQTQLETIHSALLRAEMENRVLKFKCSGLEEDIKHLELKCEVNLNVQRGFFAEQYTTQMENSKLKHEKSELQIQNKELSEELDMLLGEHVKLTGQFERTEEEVKKLKLENTDLRKNSDYHERHYFEKVEECNAATAKSANLIKDLKKDRAALSKASNELAVIQAELKTKDKLVASALSKTAEAKKLNQSMLQEMERLQAELLFERKKRHSTERMAIEATLEAKVAKEKAEEELLRAQNTSLSSSQDLFEHIKRCHPITANLDDDP